MYSKRIKEIASMISGYKTITDVGTDHAYLPIYLLKYCKYQYAYASDINKGPLDIARKNILKCKLQDKIELILSNGLKNLDNKSDLLVIAGMGGLLIKDILKNDINKLDNYNLILVQANKDMHVVREELMKLNYEIIDEKVILDKKYYQISLFKKSDKEINYNQIELKYGPINILNHDKVFNEYLLSILDKYENIEIKSPEIIKNIDEIKKLVF